MDINLEKLGDLLLKAKAARVESLKIGDIEIKFAPYRVEDRNKQKIKEAASEIAPPSDGVLKEAEEMAHAESNLRDAEDDLEHMLIDDPVLFERLVIERDLTDDAKAFN